MNKKLVSLVSLVIVLCMVLAMVAGCASTPTDEPTKAPETETENEGTETENEGTDAPAEGKKVSFTHYYDISSHNVDMTTEIVVEVMKRTNVDVTYTCPTSDDGQELNIMMSSGDLPEILTIDRTKAALGTLIDSGAVYCINDLMEQYYPSMLTDLEPEYLTFHKYKDGKNYYWTNYIYTPWVTQQPDYPKIDAVFQTTSMRKDVFEACGSPDITDKGNQAYFDLMAKAKELYPDMDTLYFGQLPTNGGLFMNTDSPSWSLHGDFGLAQYDVTKGEDGDVLTSSIRSEKFFEMISFMNELYRAGILTPSSFVDDGDIHGQKIDNMQVAAWHSTIANHAYMAGAEAVVQLPHYREDSHFIKSGAGWLATMVTTKTEGEVLEGVMRFLGYQTTMEGRILCGWGIEGRHWEWKDETKTEPVKTALWDEMEDPSDYTKKWGFWQTRAMHDQYYCNSLFEKWTDERLAWYELYGDCIVVDNFDGVRNPALDNSTEGVILAKLNEAAFSNWTKMVLANSEEELKANYDAFIAECDTIGLPTIEEYWTNRWNLFYGN